MHLGRLYEQSVAGEINGEPNDALEQMQSIVKEYCYELGYEVQSEFNGPIPNSVCKLQFATIRAARRYWFECDIHE